MTDAHCHVPTGAARHFICREPDESAAECVAGRDLLFLGIHPWRTLGVADADSFRRERLYPLLSSVRQRVASGAAFGIGEIGLDRLKERTISPLMRETFEAQLALAAELGRPVVLHGAKCWGEVVRACQPYAGRIPAFLFHGFSRSGGLLPDIVKLNGYISVGPAILNDHAVNYRELVKAIPLDRLLVETDATAENAAELPSIEQIAAKVADLRGISAPPAPHPRLLSCRWVSPVFRSTSFLSVGGEGGGCTRGAERPGLVGLPRNRQTTTEPITSRFPLSFDGNMV